MIKNIVFDFGNVLLKWNQTELSQKYSNIKEEQEQIEKVIFRSKEWIDLDNGLLNYKEAKLIFKDNLPDNLSKKVDEIMDTWYTKMPVITKTHDLIKKLKQNHYKIYGLSNTHIVFYKYIKSLEIGKYFDGFVISSVEKMMKPDEDIYYRLFEKYKLKPEECFFIDDGENNILTGRKLGMKGHIFDMNNFKSLEEDLIKNGINLS